MTYSTKEVSEVLNISVSAVQVRAKNLNLKRDKFVWNFTVSDYHKLLTYQKIKRYKSRFNFSRDGEFLIILSTMNKL